MDLGKRIKTIDVVWIAMMVTIIEVCKWALSFLPNIELTSFWIIIFSIYFGRRIYWAIPVFILVEGFMYGIGLWWIMYLYTWPILVIVTRMLRKVDSVIFWSVISSVFGLMFGFFCSIPYYIIGFASGGFLSGLSAGFTWWVAGIPWDVVHGIGNFVLMFVLYKPISAVIKRNHIDQFISR